MYVCMYVYTHICMCVCIYIYIYQPRSPGLMISYRLPLAGSGSLGGFGLRLAGFRL